MNTGERTMVEDFTLKSEELPEYIAGIFIRSFIGKNHHLAINGKLTMQQKMKVCRILIHALKSTLDEQKVILVSEIEDHLTTGINLSKVVLVGELTSYLKVTKTS